MEAENVIAEFVPQGILEGHNNWVTSIVAGNS